MHYGIAIDMGTSRGSIAARLDEVMPIIEAAERQGFESIWLGESYAAGPDDVQGFHLPSPFLVLATLARRTGLLLGTGVTLLRAWHPLRLAYDVAVLDQITGGRLVLGVGLGPEGLERRFGSTLRSLDVDEVVRFLRVAWSAEADDAHSTKPIWPAPDQPGGPPLLIGGGTARSVVRAARLGDGWYASSGYTRARIAKLAVGYARAADEYGVDPTARSVVANRITFVSSSREMARDRAQVPLGVLVDRYRQIGTVEPEIAADPSTLWRELVLWGNPKDVRLAVAALMDIGVTSIQFRVCPEGISTRDAVESMRLLAQEVLTP